MADPAKHVIQATLGREVLDMAEEIRRVQQSGGRVNARLWSELLARLKQHAPELMNTSCGRVFKVLLLDRIERAS